MERRIKIGLIFCFALFSGLLIFTAISHSDMFGRRDSGFIEGPTLLYPTTNDIDLTGKDNLEFRWERTELVATRYFNFKLYKGNDISESNLILKQQFDTEAYPIKIPASQFEAGQTYTWVLVQVFLSGEKSDRAFSSFTVIKK